MCLSFASIVESTRPSLIPGNTVSHSLPPSTLIWTPKLSLCSSLSSPPSEIALGARPFRTLWKGLPSMSGRGGPLCLVFEPHLCALAAVPCCPCCNLWLSETHFLKIFSERTICLFQFVCLHCWAPILPSLGSAGCSKAISGVKVSGMGVAVLVGWSGWLYRDLGSLLSVRIG